MAFLSFDMLKLVKRVLFFKICSTQHHFSMQFDVILKALYCSFHIPSFGQNYDGVFQSKILLNFIFMLLFD